MANIRTITLTGAEQEIRIGGANCAIRNDGAGIVYAAAFAGVTAGADGVLSIPAGGAAVLLDSNGTVYLTGSGDVQLVGSDYCELPFKTVSAGSGGSGADEVARAAISSHSGNAEIHVTAEEKEAWSDTDADTLDGKHASDFVQVLPAWTSGEFSELALAATSGNTVINNAVTGMPEDNAWWLAHIVSAMGYVRVEVSRFGSNVVRTNAYHAASGEWSGWSGGDSAVDEEV